MKTYTVKLNDYRSQFGSLSGRTNEETLALWQKIKALPMVEVLIVEPEKGEKVATLKARLYAKTRKFVNTAPFEVKFLINRAENHIAVMKMAKQAQALPGA